MYFPTVAEYDVEITLFRQAIQNLATAQSYTYSTGGSSRQFVRARLDEYKSYLKELIYERDQLAGGESAPAGRTYAGNGGGRW